MKGLTPPTEDINFDRTEHIVIIYVSEIYRIVSQKQIQDGKDSENIPNNNVQTIHVGSTETFAERRKQCCNQ